MMLNLSTISELIKISRCLLYIQMYTTNASDITLATKSPKLLVIATYLLLTRYPTFNITSHEILQCILHEVVFTTVVCLQQLGQHISNSRQVLRRLLTDRGQVPDGLLTNLPTR